MPILEINILGSKIEIDYQENEKEKLIYLIEQFKLRLSELENLKVRFADNKIIFLAALKAEDTIYELKKTIQDQKKIINSSNVKKENIDDKIKEIINIKDQVFSLNEKNQKLENQNIINMKTIEKLNQKIVSLINKIVGTRNNDY